MKNKNEPKHVIQLVEAGCYLTTAQASIYLGLSPRTLEKYRSLGRTPNYITYDRAIRYPAEALLNFIKEKQGNG